MFDIPLVIHICTLNTVFAKLLKKTILLVLKAYSTLSLSSLNIYLLTK